jgi:hypothetical protein
MNLSSVLNDKEIIKTGEISTFKSGSNTRVKQIRDQHTILLLFLLMVSTQFSCKGAVKSELVGSPIEKQHVFFTVDSIEASRLINSDDIDGFFESISVADIQIQMKRSNGFSSRDEAIDRYKSYLTTQVSNWTAADRIAITEVIESAIEKINRLSPGVIPDTIKLIKIKTGHYGEDVYYTRGKSILIPENIFADFEAEKQLPVMLHEIFHIISRYNEGFRDTMYKMIGFERAGKMVLLPKKLNEVILTNPDGVSRTHIINLNDRNDYVKQAIPLITSKYKGFRADWPAFFDYLNFDLYEVEDDGAGNLVVKLNENGGTTLQLDFSPSFFTKIRDNTQYIIHPEEIMADNFMLAVLAYSNKDYSKFSSKGKTLIEQVIGTLKTIAK